MSVEASAWAFRQAVPPKPKMVLMALADQADERTGYVCYGKTDMAHLARKASVPERSLYRYIGALILNGYILRESGKGRGHPNTYWLKLDRPHSELSDWKWGINGETNDDAGEPQDVVGNTATVAVFNEAESIAENLPHNGRPGLPLVADHNTSEHKQRKVDDEKRGCSFSQEAQDVARAKTPEADPTAPLHAYPIHSPGAAALRMAYEIAGQAHFCDSIRTVGGIVYHRSEVDPQLLALVEAPPHREWPKLSYPQATAWNKLFEPFMPRIWTRLKEGSRAPWPWPPSKDGKIYASTGPPGSLMSAQDEADLDQLGKMG